MSVIRVNTTAGVKRDVLVNAIAYYDSTENNGASVTLTNGFSFEVQESAQKLRSHIRKATGAVEEAA